MKSTCVISKDDYRRAKMMKNHVAILVPAKSPMAQEILKNSDAIIWMYEQQMGGKKLGNGAANILGMHLQYATLFSAALKQKTRA